jgi:hypothetical protein
MAEPVKIDFLKAEISGENTIYTAYDYKNIKNNEEIEINNDLTISITNLSKTNTLELSYDSSKKNPSINDTSAYLQQPRIYVYFPVGDKKFHMTTMELAKKIKCSVSRGWKVEMCDTDAAFKNKIYWTIFPDTTDSNLKFRPGDSLIVYFDGIKSYTTSNRMTCVCIDIRDIVNVSDTKEYLPVFIVQPEPRIRNFSCSQNFAGILDKVEFSWEVLGNIKQTQFYPGYGENGETNISAKGDFDCVINESTNFTIRVYGENDIVYGYCPVTVDEPVVILSTMDGKTEYKYGEDIALKIKLMNTNHCYLNEGIGKIDIETKYVNGYPVIEATKKVECNNRRVEFCASCLGKEGLVKDKILIEITDYVDIQNIVFKRVYLPDKNSFRYSLYWNILNATSLEIRTSDNIERTNSKEGSPVLSGSAVFENNSKEPLEITVEAKGSSGQYLKERFKCQKQS